MKKYRVYYNHSNKYLFLPYSIVEDYDYTITLEDYEMVFTGNTDYLIDEIALNNIFELFNSDIVSLLKIRSLSVSDIIEIDNRYYYVDSIGFTEISL